MKLLAFLLLNSLIFSLNLSAQTIAKIKVREVKGYKVRFVYLDTPSNLMTLASYTPNGSYHDDPSKAGMAHLWEHVIHRSNQKYPNGEKAWNRLRKRAAGMVNAYTASNHTLYYYAMHPDAFDEVAEYLGAMVTLPRWSQKDFEKEKKVVKNEAKQYFQRDSYILGDMIFNELAPEGHPFKMYHIGTQAQLESYTMDDLKDLYYSNFRPGSLELLVVGSKPENEDKLVQKLDKYFEKIEIPQGSSPAYTTKFIPNLIPSGKKSRFIEIPANSSTKMISLTFQVDEKVFKENTAALEILHDFLNSSAKNSLQDILLKEGLVTSTAIYPDQVNNLGLMKAKFSLTEKGLKNYSRVLSIFYEYMGQLSKNGIDEENINHFINGNLVSYKSHFRDALGTMKNIAWSSHLRTSEEINFKKHFKDVSTETTKKLVAHIFRPENSIGGIIGQGPLEETGKNLKYSNTFERTYNKAAFKETTQKWSQAFNGTLANSEKFFKKAFPRLTPSKLQLGEEAKKPLKRAEDKLAKKVKLKNQPGVHFLLKESHLNTDVGVSITIMNETDSLAKQTPRSYLTKKMLNTAFNYQNRQLFAQMNAEGYLKEVTLGHQGLSFTIEANRDLTSNIYNTLFKTLNDFTPTEESLAYARSAVRRGILQENDGFSGHIAGATARKLTNRTAELPQDYAEYIDQISIEELTNAKENYFRESDIYISAVGDYNERYAKKLAHEIEDIFPKRLSEEQRAKLGYNGIPILKTASFHHPMPTKEHQAIGIAKIYPGPELFTKDHAAMMVFNRELSEANFGLNRATYGLGYVHGAEGVMSSPSMVDDKRRLHTSIYSMTDDKRRWGTILKGWDEIKEKIKTGTLSGEDNYQDALTGLIRSYDLVSHSLSDEAGLYMSNYAQSGNPNSHHKIRELLMSLTKEDIDEAGKKYISDLNPHLTLFASKNKADIKAYQRGNKKLLDGCGELLSKTSELRKVISGK